MSLTLATLRLRVTGAIGLSNAVGSSERSLVEGWLNEACEQYLIETKCRIREIQLTLTAGEDDFVLPTPVLAFKRLWVAPASGQDVSDLEPVSIDELRDRRRYGSTGFPTAVYCLNGTDLLMLDPVPQSSSDVLHALYVPAPNLMTNDTDTPYTAAGIPSWGHPAIEEYAKWKAADWDDDTTSKIGETYMNNWVAMVKQARLKINKLDGGWQPARPGPRHRRRTPYSPGVDIKY